MQVAAGTHQLRVEWEDEGQVLATTSRTVIVGGDSDGDGVVDARDNCRDVANADQSNIDGKGDACDPDLDGDGHANSKERTHGTDERDPTDYPRKRKLG